MKKWTAMLLAFILVLCAASAMAACTGGNEVSSDTLDSGSFYLPDGGYTGDLTIEGNVTLCLHGQKLNGRIFIESDAHLTLEDCIGGGSVSATDDDAVENEGKFTMNRGSICTTSADGVENEGEFTMNGGSVITVNDNGVENEGTFTMNGGSISTENGSAVENEGEFTMNDGSVWVTDGYSIENEGEFIMNDGNVLAMNGYGVYNYGINGSFKVAAGTIVGGDLRDGYCAVYGATEAAAIASGSYKAIGAFEGTEVVVAKGVPSPNQPQNGGQITDDGLPLTGDSSRFGLWMPLLALAGVSMLMLRKRARN